MSKARELAALGNAYSDGALSNRNLIINGAMQVAQRGTSVTGKTTGGYATVDRWKFIVGSAGTWTEEQGASLGEFGNSFKITCTTADASLSAGDYVQIETALEGQNLQHIRKGTSDAKPLVLSFAARSDDAKSFVVEVYDNDNARHYCELFTLTGGGAVDTFVMSIPADTTGALGNDNAASLYVTFWLAAGTNYSSGTLPITWSGVTAANRAAGCSNFADATGNYFEVSGVQLEVGDTATPFEHRSYGQELALCQRYYQRIGNNDGSNTHLMVGGVESATTHVVSRALAVVMRVPPTVTLGDAVRAYSAASLTQTVNSFSTRCSRDIACLVCTVAGTSIAGQASVLYGTDSVNSTGKYMEFDAEL